MKWYSYILIGIIVVGIILVQRKFFPETRVITHTDTFIKVKDTTIFKDKLVPYLVKGEDRIDTIEIPADSAKIVAKYIALHKEFFTKRYYSDTIPVDSMGYIYNSFRVYMNQADSLSTHYSLVQKKIVNQTVAYSKNSLYISGFLGKNMIQPTVTFVSKDKYSYSLGYNVLNNSVTFGVGVNINKLKFR